MDNLLSKILPITGEGCLPGKKLIGNVLNDVIDVLKPESIHHRPRGTNGNPGGLIKLQSLPTIIVSDLHARVGYLKSVLLWKPPDMKYNVYWGLSSGKLRVVCVGDGFHSESRVISRWKKALGEYTMDFIEHKAMDEEMSESLGVIIMMMKLKTTFPHFFHFLKGNHENIANENSADNRSFRKFVYEGVMVTAWFKEFMGKRLFERYYKFEKMLPVFAIGDRFCVTHAEPKTHYSEKDIVNALVNREIIFNLTWTDNGQAEIGSVVRYLYDFFPDNQEARMFGGHRPIPISQNYLSRAGGKYIQIHNPSWYNIVYVRDMKDFLIYRDIFSILPLAERLAKKEEI